MVKDDNLRDDRLSKFIQERLENEAIEFDPAAWEAMEKKLDEHMPTGKNLTGNETKKQLQINEPHPKNSQPAEKNNSYGEEDKPVVKKSTQNNFFTGYTIHGDNTGYWIYNSTYSESTVEIYHLQGSMTTEVIITDLKKPIKPSQLIYMINQFNMD